MAGVEDFFDSDTLDQKPTGQSVLAERYLRAGIPIIGGEQVYEIILNDYSDRFWACRICNAADSTLDTIDAHMHSREHVHAAFKAYKIFDAYKAEVDAAAESEHWAIEYKHLIEHIRQVGPLQPLAYYLTNTPNDLAKTLGITINKKEINDVVEEITDTINIVHCNSCNEVYFSEVDKEKSLQAKFDHCATVNHQRCIYINSFLKSLMLTKKDGLPATVNAKEESDLLVSAEDGIAYGPALAFQHCVAFGGQSEFFCNICYSLIRCEHVREHFSSEAHIERFLRSKTPSNYVNIEYEPIDKRRSKIESELAGHFKELAELFHWDAGIATPTLLREIVFPEKRSLTVAHHGTIPPNVLLCDICNTCFTSKQQSWEDHVFDEQHFERLVAKQKVERDPRSFIYENSDLPRLHRQKKAHWTDQGQIHNVQNYGEFALDLIFRDVVACEYICSCCYETFPEEDPQSVIFHTRSLSHIKAALCIVNPVFAAKLLTTRNEVELKAMVLDYLQNRETPIFETKMRVFDPNTAFILNSQVKIPRILLRLSVVDPNARDGIIADYGFTNTNGEISIFDDKDYLCLTMALETTNLLLTRIDSKVVVFWCNDCHTSFSAFQRDLKTIWTDHLLTDLHWQRANILKQNELGLNCLLDGTSQYQPTLFDQSGIKKKIPWFWNDEKGCYQFVLNNKCHLHDVFQQYNFQGSNRVFCSLCCEIIELSEDSLTAHVRSLRHLIFYMHKYYSQDVVQLEDILADNAKEIIIARLITRDHIADKIRSSETKNSRVLLFDARGGYCEYPVIQQIVEDENRLFKLGMVKVVAKINSLPSTAFDSIASLHNLPTPKPNKMNIKQQVLLHMVLKNVLSDKFPDKRPASLEDLVKETQPPPKQKNAITGPIASRVKLGFDGQINVQLNSSIAPVPPPIGVVAPVPAPVPAPVMAPVPINITPMPAPVRIDEPTPMDISDDEGPRRRSRSRTYSSEDRYETPSWRNIRSKRSRSRSPIRKGGLRSDDPREYENRKHEEESWRDRDQKTSRRDDPYKRDDPYRRDDPYKQQKERGRSPPSHRNRSPPSTRNRSPPSSSRSSRYEKEPSRRGDISPPRRRSRSPRRSSPPPRRTYYDDSPTAPRYADDERPSSHSSRTPRYIEQEEYSNHSRSDMMRNEEELYRQYRLANPSPIPDFNQPPPSMMGGDQRPISANGSSLINDMQHQQQQQQHNDPKYNQIIRHLPVITPNTTILPTVDLTKPPPPLPAVRLPIQFGAPPPTFGGPPPGMGMPGGMGMPPPGYPGPQQFGMPPPPIPQQQPIDQAELVKKAKMDLYNRDLIKLTGRGQLVEYLMKQSSDPIPSTDPPLLFNEVLKTKQAIIGADQVAQVLCYGEPDYETYLCIMCQYWTTVSDMFKHLKDETHRLNYMNKSYKLQHAKVIVEDKRERREAMLHEFSLKISKCEGGKLCNTRMRTILNSTAVLKIWPEFLDFVDNSWKLGEDEEEAMPVPTNGSSATVQSRRRSLSPRSREKSSSSRNPYSRETERSRESDRSRSDKRRSDERRRTPPRDSRGRDSSSRSRRSKSPRSSSSNRKTSPEDTRPMWEKQAERFRKEMELISNNPAIDYDDVSKAESERISARVAATRTQVNDRQSSNNGAFEEEYDRQFSESNERVEAEEEPRMSAAEKRIMEQEQEKNKLKEFQRYVSALILIRSEAMDNRGVDREAVERICKDSGVTPDKLFSDEVLEDAARRIGSDSIYTLMAIAHHYHHQNEPAPSILVEASSEAAKMPHPATLLAQVGMDKSSIANLLRKVAMSKLGYNNDEESDKNSNLSEAEKKARRGKRGGVKQKLKEMQAKLRTLQHASGVYDYPPNYYGGGSRDMGGGGYYDEYAAPTGPPPSRGPPSGYYQDDYYYGGGEDPTGPPHGRYNHMDYDYPRPSSATSSSRTPAYPAGYPAPTPRPQPSRQLPGLPYGYNPDPDIEWIGGPPPRPKTKAATGGNTVPLGPPRLRPTGGGGYGNPATRTPTTAAPSTAPTSSRPSYDPSRYDYPGYPSQQPPPPQPSSVNPNASASSQLPPPKRPQPGGPNFSNDWDEAASLLQNLFN